MDRRSLALNFLTACLLTKFGAGASARFDSAGALAKSIPLRRAVVDKSRLTDNNEMHHTIFKGSLQPNQRTSVPMAFAQRQISRKSTRSKPHYQRSLHHPLFIALQLPTRTGYSTSPINCNDDTRQRMFVKKSPSVLYLASHDIGNGNDDLLSPPLENSNHEPENNESLRQAIANLVSIIDSSDSSKNASPSLSPHSTTSSSSIVHVIGTGLTPSLLSLPLSTIHTLSKADVVLYDSLGLSHKDICIVVPKHCEVICVGKRGDSMKSWKQSDIDDLILQMVMGKEPSPLVSPSGINHDDVIDQIKDGSNNQQQQQQQSSKARTIVRLKGGDPFLFGRTRTEIESLRSNNIPYTYTPNISSCIAGPHLGGIPLTDALLNCQSFGVWTGTDAFGRSRGLKGEANENDNVKSSEIRKDVDGLDVDTHVFLMIGRLDKLEALCHMLAYGDANGDGKRVDHRRRKWDENTPCAIIQNAGGRRIPEDGKDSFSDDSNLPIQRVWRSTLGNIVPMIRKEDETRTSVSPAVFVVGATCQLDLLSQ